MSDKSQMRMILIWRADFITPIPEPMFHVEHRARKKKSRKPLISLKFWRGGASAKAKWNYDGVARAIVPNRAGFVKSFFHIR